MDPRQIVYLNYTGLQQGFTQSEPLLRPLTPLTLQIPHSFQSAPQFFDLTLNPFTYPINSYPQSPLIYYHAPTNYPVVQEQSSQTQDRKDSPQNTSNSRSLNQRFARIIFNYQRTNSLSFDKITLDEELDYSILNNNIFLFKNSKLNNHALIIFKKVCAHLDKHGLLSKLLTDKIYLQENSQENPSLAQYLIDRTDHPELFDAYVEQLCKLKNPDMAHFDSVIKSILKSTTKKNELLNVLFKHINDLQNEHPFKKHLSSYPDIMQFFAEKNRNRPSKDLNIEKLIEILRSGNAPRFFEYCNHLKKQFAEYYKELTSPEEKCFRDDLRINYGNAFAKKKLCEAFCDEFQKGFNPLAEIYKTKSMDMFIAYKKFMMEIFGQDKLLKLNSILVQQAKNLMPLDTSDSSELAKNIRVLAFDGNFAHTESFSEYGFIPLYQNSAPLTFADLGIDKDRKSIISITDPEYDPRENKKIPKAITRPMFFFHLPKNLFDQDEPKHRLSIFKRLYIPS